MAKLREAFAFRTQHINQLEELHDSAQEACQNVAFKLFFQRRYKHVEEIRKGFMERHAFIIGQMSLQNDPDFLAEENIRRDFDKLYFEIEEAYYRLFPPVEAIRSPMTETTSVRTPQIKLPKIELRTFEGKLANWTPFIDLFNTLIHTNDSLSPIEKFQYLVSSLTNEPLSIVKGLPLTADNYSIAYDALQHRYENKRLLATTYWHAIESAPKISSESHSALRGLLNTFSENLSALNQLSVDKWDFVLFHCLLQKLDNNTRKRFEIEFSKSEIPKYQDLKDFVDNHCKALETCSISNKAETSNKWQSKQDQHLKGNSRYNTSSLVVNTNSDSGKIRPCVRCKAEHSLYRCDDFTGKPPQERYEVVKRNKICLNCLQSSHMAKDCKSKFCCRTCNARHHTLLHFDQKSNNVNAASGGSSAESGESQTVLSAISSVTHFDTVLLATAKILVVGFDGTLHQVRALLDSGSQCSLMTERCRQRLGLSREKVNAPIHGIGSSSCQVSSGVTCQISSRHDISFTPLRALVISKICERMPSILLRESGWSHIKNLPLADDDFGEPLAVDILLGADLFPSILVGNKRVGRENEPIAFETTFGWILTGKVNSMPSQPIKSFCATLDLNIALQRFWKLEEPPTVTTCSPEEALAEAHYAENTTRDSFGRYQVALPFKVDSPKLGESYSVALKRLTLLEQRLAKNPALREDYHDFLRGYIRNGYMTPVEPHPTKRDSVYYIPHHFVQKPGSSTTKLRVVFDGSCKSSTSVSLNDLLLVGPKLQLDIARVLLRFRSHNVALIADIKQMFLQIRIDPKQRDYQRILWRSSPDDPVQEYQLNTVTFGLTSSPFLAIRTLHQLAKDEQVRYPLASKVLLTDTYVDDVITGASSIDEAVQLQRELIDMLHSGGFELRKWGSNEPTLIDHLPEELKLSRPLRFEPQDEGVKVLGLKWDPDTDSFSYSVTPIDRAFTKRNVLSEIARIFDPLGLLSPLTLYAKRLIQILWTMGIEWDEELPAELADKWKSHLEQLPNLSKLKIDRLLPSTTSGSLEVHGFCDASEAGYAAVIYFRSVNTGRVTISLICGKSKVSPLKRVTLPRLELCAAALLANLMRLISDVFELKEGKAEFFAWSDSQVALQWLRSSPHRWKTFVSNRVSQIQEDVDPSCWHYVPSEQNSADCGSRGLLPNDLLKHSLWWTGPSFLTQSAEEWPQTGLILDRRPETEEEERRLTLIVSKPTLELLDSLLENHSNLGTVLRIVAHCKRFVFNCKNPHTKRTGFLIKRELNEALLLLTGQVQRISFREEIKNLEKGGSPSKPLKRLTPFLDPKGLLRVGGRLAHSSLSMDQKHPLLLPKNHKLTELVILDCHYRNLHAGLGTVRFLLRQQFWILSDRLAIKGTLSRCLNCFKHKPRATFQPKMGQLPPARISQTRAFNHTGVDFGGPFRVTMGKIRGAKVLKAYVCLFVCFATRALHLELVSDLSTDAFLAALRRFVARRGRCEKLFSDNGTNFVGAHNVLTSVVAKVAEAEAIEWQFNPPSAPHFGGLWEAGIKSVKTHLARVIGDQLLTYEELNTVLIQIEAVLNSRPLCPLSEDPNDLGVLTPGHFLTLEPLTTVPEQDCLEVPSNRLTRWRLLQQMHQSFWRRWHQEYLNTLQQTNNWTKTSNNAKVGDLVLIHDDCTPPLKWRRGRITELHHGKDGIARVATVKIQNGTCTRPLVKLYPLPMA